MKIWYLIQYEVIMMLIWCIRYVFKINIIIIGIIWHTADTTLYWKLHIFIFIIFICWMQSYIENHWNYNYHLSRKTNNQFKRDLNVIMIIVILSHTTEDLFIWNIVNEREWIMQTVQIFHYNQLKAISKWFHTFIPRHPQYFESRPLKKYH